MTQITSGLVIWNSTNSAQQVTYSESDRTITFNDFSITGITAAPKVYNNCEFVSGSTVESYKGASTSQGSISCDAGYAIIISPGASGDSLACSIEEALSSFDFGGHSISSGSTMTIEDGGFLVLGCPEIILTSNGFDGNGNPIAVTYSGTTTTSEVEKETVVTPNPIIAAISNGGKGRIDTYHGYLRIKNKARVHLGAYQYGNGTLEVKSGATLIVGDGVNDCELNIGASNKSTSESKLSVHANCIITNSTINLGGSGNGSSGTGGSGTITINIQCFINNSVVFCGGPGGMNGGNGTKMSEGGTGGSGGVGGFGGSGTLTISSSILNSIVFVGSSGGGGTGGSGGSYGMGSGTGDGGGGGGGNNGTGDGGGGGGTGGNGGDCNIEYSMNNGGNNGGCGAKDAYNSGYSGASNILTISGQNQVKNKLILFGTPVLSGNDKTQNLQIDSIDHCVIFCGVGNFNNGTMRRAALDIDNHGYIGQVSPINFGTMTPGTLTLPSGYSFPPINQAFPRGTGWEQTIQKPINLHPIFYETDDGNSILENQTINHFCYQSYQDSVTTFPNTDSNLICINPTKTYSTSFAKTSYLKANNDGSLVFKGLSSHTATFDFLYFNGSGTGRYNIGNYTDCYATFIHGSKSQVITQGSRSQIINQTGNTSLNSGIITIPAKRIITFEQAIVEADVDLSSLNNDLTFSGSTVETPIKVTGGSTISKITFENGKMSSAQTGSDSSTFTIVDNGKTVALDNVVFGGKSFKYVGNVNLTNIFIGSNPKLTFGNANLRSISIYGNGTLECESGTTLTITNEGGLAIDNTTKLIGKSSVTLTGTDGTQDFSGSEIKNSTITANRISGAINAENSKITCTGSISGNMTINNSNLDAIAISNSDSLTISGSTFENQCQIANTTGTLEIDDSSFDNDVITNSGTTLTISGSTFSNSSSVTNLGTTTISNSKVTGSIGNVQNTTLTITDSNLEIQSLSSSSGTLTISGSTFSGTTSLTNSGATTISNSAIDCKDFKTGNQSNTNISNGSFSLGKFENNGEFISDTQIENMNIINNGTIDISGDPLIQQEPNRTLIVEKDVKLIINRHDIKSNGQVTPSIVLGKDFTVSKNLTFTSNGQLYLGVEPPRS